MKEEARKYTLTMDREQAEILLRALDIFSRIGLGQFEKILDVYDRAMTRPLAQREDIQMRLKAAKEAAGHPGDGSFGIHNSAVNDEFRVAYDIQQVVRHRLAFDRRPQGGYGVAFDTPRAISKLPLPEISSRLDTEKNR